MQELIGYTGAAAVGVGLSLVVAGRRQAKAQTSALPLRRDELPATSLERPLVRRLGEPLLARLAAAGRRITIGGRSHALRRRLENAGMPAAVEIFLAAKVVTIAVLVLVALAVLAAAGRGGTTAVAVLVVAAAVGYAAPELAVLQRGQRRQQRLNAALPEALDLLALTVQAGLGLEQALAQVAAEVDGPLSEELDRLLREQQLGRSRWDALEALHARNASEDLRRLVAALLHADRLGTLIAATLSVQARELRRRRRGRARERAGKAPVKLLFPLLFGIFPAMFVVILGPAALRIADALFTSR